MPSNHAVKWLRNTLIVWPLLVAAIIMACAPLARAGAAGNDFNVQVAPSPLAISLTPGQTQTATLTVRNFSSHSETLQPELRGIRVGADSEKVSLDGIVPADMKSWTHFSPALLTIEPGKSAQLTVHYDTPHSVGFSYAVAIALTSTTATRKTSNGAAIKPQIDVFCLININRSDAKSELGIIRFNSDKSRYAFLPATFNVTIKNSGNIINQPSGTVFIQRTASDTQPIATLPINRGGGYVLPGTTRTFSTSWDTGFPVYVTDKSGKKHLEWNWKHLSNLRMGRYVAKAVLVYNNGQQDMPLIMTYSFWVIPWWLLLFVLATVIILVMGLITWGRLIFVGTKKMRGYAAQRKK